MAWIALIGPIGVLAMIGLLCQAVKDAFAKPVVDGKTDARMSPERLAWLRELGKRDGTWEPLRDFNNP